MDDQMKQLLPVVSWLTDKYTAKESSSVSYETAQGLMEAVLYCIELHSQNTLVSKAGGGNARAAYDSGYQMVIATVYDAKEVYEQVIKNFNDYGCRNYRDTIIKGMPAFFVNYDARFAPWDHLLTLDYPLLSGYPKGCGVTKILKYLQGTALEQQFLSCFSQDVIIRLLEQNGPEYQTLYLDNICYPVLLTAVGATVAGCLVGELQLSAADYLEINNFFRDDDVEKTALKVKQIIRLLITQMIGAEAADYFEMAADDYAVRIRNGIMSPNPADDGINELF